MIDVQKLSELARLSVTAEESASLAKDLDQIIAFVDQVAARDASGAAPAHDRVNVFREDIVDPLETAYDLVAAAPSNQDGFVKVPKIIE